MRKGRNNPGVALSIFILAALLTLAISVPLPLTPQASRHESGMYSDSLVVAPHYVGYLTDSDERFAHQVSELKRRLGSASHVLIGFAASLPIQFPATELDQTLTKDQMAETLQTIDRIVERAAINHVIVHITLTSGFFHDMNDLRPTAIRQDVRNAQWFADGWIGDPSSFAGAATAEGAAVPSSAWITPSRYARPLRARMEEGARIVGAHLAASMAAHMDTLLTISGDGEVELNYERNIAGGEHLVGNTPIYADYSPFMVEEFRDWIQHNRYEGDRSPATDDNQDGHTFNQDFATSFSTWRLRYFDSSGPIPLSTYLKMADKLPSSGPYFVDKGFDAPRMPLPGTAFWDLWMEFRKQAVANYVRDFASWITTSGVRVPASHFYSHQIPADYLFGTPDSLRLRTSASPVQTAFLFPTGSTGVTVFNTFDGRSHKKTGAPALFDLVSRTSANWGVFEYNPSVPGVGKASTDIFYYLGELRILHAYHPHVIVPFAWTDVPSQHSLNIQNSAFEFALKRFIEQFGNVPWAPR
jgi:hypothetical protein